MILDITFYEENKLVDQEFPEDCSPFKIQQLLQDLTEPEVLVTRLAPGQEVCLQYMMHCLGKKCLVVQYKIFILFCCLGDSCKNIFFLKFLHAAQQDIQFDDMVSLCNSMSNGCFVFFIYRCSLCWAQSC